MFIWPLPVTPIGTNVMSSRSQKMEFSPDLPVWFIALGTAVITLFGTLGVAVMASLSSQKRTAVEAKKNEAQNHLGTISEDRAWANLQIETMERSIKAVQAELAGNRAYYEGFISNIHKEHRTELEKQEKHHKEQIAALNKQVDYLTRQINAYGIDLRKAGICIQSPSFESDNGS